MASADPLPSSLNRRIEGLDELRGLAILSVLFAHSFQIREQARSLSNLNIGGAGVDLFFMISGYLITVILLKGNRQPGAIQRFYVRRIFRIIPLFLVVLIVGFALGMMRGQSLAPLLCYVTFSQNLLAENPPIGDLLPAQFRPYPGLGPLWSLAVEEHTYLLLPWIIRFLSPSNVRVSYCLLAACGITLKFFAMSSFVGPEHQYVYTNPHETWFRMQYILLGGILAFPGCVSALSVLFAGWLVLCVCFGFGYLEWTIAMLGCVAVQRCVSGAPLIRNVLLARLGVLCYGIYLLHIFILRALEAFHPSPEIAFIMLTIFSVFAAEISFRYFEKPTQAMRTHFEPTAVASQIGCKL